jgi:putative acetyltransferase
MLIRDETAADATAIRAVIEAAFCNMPFSQQTEHRIVDELRRQKALFISLVAEEEGKVVGHIAFSPATVDGRDIDWFALGPLAVAPDRQRQGIGKALVRAGLKRLRTEGGKGCIVLGSTTYYPLFGFRRDARLVGDGVPAEHFMVRDFIGGVPAGTAAFHPAFFITR